MIELFNEDCMEGMAKYPDKWFDIAICDPPYFDGPQKVNYYAGTKQRCDVGTYKDLRGSWEPLDEVMFQEIKRVSKNQIIWGINYFHIIAVGGRIVWIKGQQGSPFSMADIAYQSFYNRIDVFNFLWSGFWKEEPEIRIHPTQKPVKLYEWLLKNYAKPGDKILDTHGGSMSSAIACYNLDYDLTLFEIDADYFNAGKARLEEHMKQQRLFDKV